MTNRLPAASTRSCAAAAGPGRASTGRSGRCAGTAATTPRPSGRSWRRGGSRSASASPVSPGLAIDHLRLVRLVAAVLLAHLAGCGRTRRRRCSTPCRARTAHGLAVAHRAHPDDAAVLHDEIVERCLGPDRDAAVEGDAQHLADQRRAVRQQRLPPRLGAVRCGSRRGRRRRSSADAAVVVRQRPRLVGHHRQADALGQAGLQPRRASRRAPWRSTAPARSPRPMSLPPLAVRVVVAVAGAADEAHAAAARGTRPSPGRR